MPSYIQVKISHTLTDTTLLSALLFDLGCESVWESAENEILVYFDENTFEPQSIETLKKNFVEIHHLQHEAIPPKNWNEEWEKNFEPIVVAQKIYIRASFHAPQNNYPYQLLINPKMSFGTGHHHTTAMMLEAMLYLDFNQKNVLDVGTGTGILAIFAEKIGAETVTAIDIQPEAIENCLENLILNHCNDIKVHEGNMNVLKSTDKYDVILANITRNVLATEAHLYVQHLNPNGKILISGFYEADTPELVNVFEQHDIKLLRTYTSENWCCMLFTG